MIPFLNPWVFLGVFLAFGAAFAGGDVMGHRAENKAWVANVAEQKIEAGKELAAAKDQIITKEREYNDLKDTVEKDHADMQSKIDAASVSLAQLGSLHDSQGRRTCSPSGVPGSAKATGSSPPAVAGCTLSDATSKRLFTIAKQADEVLATAKACQDWAVGIK